MPSMKCTCGHVFSTGSFPNKNAHWIVSEVDFDELEEPQQADKLVQLLLSSAKMYECQKCGELIIVRRDGSEPVFYCKN
jgi:hypothetical protein